MDISLDISMDIHIHGKPVYLSQTLRGSALQALKDPNRWTPSEQGETCLAPSVADQRLGGSPCHLMVWDFCLEIAYFGLVGAFWGAVLVHVQTWA